MIILNKANGIPHVVRRYVLTPDNIPVAYSDTWPGPHIVGGDCILQVEDTYSQEIVDDLLDKINELN